MKRKSHRPRKINFNPILKPETELEQGIYGIPGASAKDGGVWWDPKDQLFKMWYEAGWLHRMAYATSKDGLHWERPNLDVVPGTNQIVPEIVADSSTVWLDHFTKNPEERFKMFLRSPNSIPGSTERFNYGFSMVSPDGIHWGKPVKTGPCGDRSTMFYNPFRQKWVYSLRNPENINRVPIGRFRYYHEHSNFLEGAKWTKEELIFWLGADYRDDPDPYIGDKAQLYNLSAVPYESIMLSLPQIHLGPSNERCREAGVPKITELKVAYSRDGFYWDRTDRRAFIPAERKEGTWDRGYVQSVGGLCTIVGDQLWFYYIGFEGNKRKKSPVYEKNGMHANGSTGIAVLRRDGFVSYSAQKEKGTLLTRPVTFTGEYMFVNVSCPNGELKVEILDADNNVIPGFSANDCKPLSTDSTIAQIKWKNKKDLSALKSQPVRFKFYLINGDLYSFWVSPDIEGASNGYNAAGGPGFGGGTDKEGKRAYKKAADFPNLLERY
nr:glycosyl hydrolase family 32 [uncultured Bacteroides sp.]